MTAEKVKAYAESVDISKLSGEARAKAIRDLADKLNSLSLEERRKARFERAARSWFDRMTEDEKAEFIEATMPTGFKQMLTSFEQLPEEKRRKAVDDALRRLKEGRDQLGAGRGGGNPGGPNAPPVLSAELQAKMRTIGLKTFYSQSSAQTQGGTGAGAGRAAAVHGKRPAFPAEMSSRRTEMRTLERAGSERGAGAEIRNPKPETRRKPEIRSSNARLCRQPKNGSRLSDFGFRLSFGFRISGFGFLRHAPVLAHCPLHTPRASPVSCFTLIELLVVICDHLPSWRRCCCRR